MFNSSEFEGLEFDLDIKEYPIYFNLSGDQITYYIREMTGQQRDDYLNALQKMMGKSAMSGGKLSAGSIQSFDGIEAELLSRVIFKEVPSDEDEVKKERVSKKEIQTWPAPVQHKLFLKAQKLTGLGDEDEKSEEEAKNG